MKIWIIDHYSVPEQYYPLIRQTNFAKHFIAMGHEVRIIGASSVHNSDINLIEDGSLYKNDTQDGVNYTYVNCISYQGNGLKRIYNMIEFAKKLPKVCDALVKEEWKPDAILACSMTLQACQASIKIAKKYGCRVVSQVTDLWPETIVSYTRLTANNPVIRYLRKIEKWIYVNVDECVFSLEGTYDYIKEQGWQDVIPESKVHTINNGVDIEAFDYNKEHFRIDDADLDNPDTFKVVYTGSIRRVNNIGKVLDAAKLVDNSKVVFIIYGKGDELPVLEQRVRDEHINNVIFKGFVDKKNIPYITCKADVNLAHFECTDVIYKYGVSFNKMFDYMASQKPIFSDFPCRYNPSVMHNCGYDIQNDTPECIAAKVDEISRLNQAELETIGRNARKSAEEIYNFDIHSERMIKYLRGN